LFHDYFKAGAYETDRMNPPVASIAHPTASTGTETSSNSVVQDLSEAVRRLKLQISSLSSTAASSIDTDADTDTGIDSTDLLSLGLNPNSNPNTIPSLIRLTSLYPDSIQYLSPSQVADLYFALVRKGVFGTNGTKTSTKMLLYPNLTPFFIPASEIKNGIDTQSRKQSEIESRPTRFPTAREVKLLYDEYKKAELIRRQIELYEIADQIDQWSRISGPITTSEESRAPASSPPTTPHPTPPSSLSSSSAASSTSSSSTRLPSFLPPPSISSSSVDVGVGVSGSLPPQSAGVIQYPTASQVESQYFAYAKVGFYGQLAQDQALNFPYKSRSDTNTATMANNRRIPIVIRYPTPAEVVDLYALYRKAGAYGNEENGIQSGVRAEATTETGTGSGIPISSPTSTPFSSSRSPSASSSMKIIGTDSYTLKDGTDNRIQSPFPTPEEVAVLYTRLLQAEGEKPQEFQFPTGSSDQSTVPQSVTSIPVRSEFPPQYTIFHPSTDHPKPSRSIVIPKQVIDYTDTDVSISLEPSLGPLPPVPALINLRSPSIEELAVGTSATSQSLIGAARTAQAARTMQGNASGIGLPVDAAMIAGALPGTPASPT